MVTTRSGHRTSNHQELSVLFPHTSLSTSIQGRLQEIMAEEPVNGNQDLYLATLDLTTLERLNLYKKAIVGLPESNRYDLTISKWTDFNQEL